MDRSVLSSASAEVKQKVKAEVSASRGDRSLESRKAALHAKLLKRTSFAPNLKAKKVKKATTSKDESKSQASLNPEEVALNR